ncbi:hypothetical protein ACQ4LE_008224 [Meloidogyne hapla]|uniref:Recep_L_domain domain-containing protein n=1 Tax=Meloidogyne hapla TaxID=6305 RepID=A0A1I8AZG8_MELHA
MFNYQILILFELLIDTNCFSLFESVTTTTITSKNLTNFENITLVGGNITNISYTNTSLLEEPQKHLEEEDESSEPVEFLETLNGDNLVKGDKVIEVRTEWNTHVGDFEAEATE